jgi:hypothetical protein
VDEMSMRIDKAREDYAATYVDFFGLPGRGDGLDFCASADGGDLPVANQDGAAFDDRQI